MTEPKTIAEHIDCLARLTGAPETFVTQVKQLFGRKGISLEDDAAPYLNALDEAFRREETIRQSARRARQSVASLQESFQRLGRAYVERHAGGHAASAATEEDGRKLRGRLERLRSPNAVQVRIRGDHRTLVTRMEREEPPLVPGPEELQ